MDVVAVYCSHCACFYLEPVYLVIEGHVPCECGAIANQLPGERYSSRDETLFDAVVTSLRVADISCLRAPALAAALQDRASLPPGEVLSRLAALEPALAVIELIATSEPRMARKAEAMFESILGAIASIRSRSGIMPRTNVGAAAVNSPRRR